MNTDKIGEYYLTYEIEYNEKKYTDKRTVKVVDEVEPVITLKGDSSIIDEGTIDSPYEIEK